MRGSRAPLLDMGRSSAAGGEAGARASLLAALATGAAGAGGAQMDAQQQSHPVRTSISSAVPRASLAVPYRPPTAPQADLDDIRGADGPTSSILGKPHVAVENLPVRQYLDLMVVPALLPALTTVVTERPDRPVEFLAHWLLENAHKYPDPASPADLAATAALLGAASGAAN